MKTLSRLALATAGFAYALIVLGFVVRITGSGMGCGDDWPLCNGKLIPSFDSVETVIEYLHRIAALGLSGLTVAVVVYAARLRGTPGGSGPGGTDRPAYLAAGLLVLQSLLGAVAVWLELPPHAVVLHLGTAMALLATLLVLGLRAGVAAGSIAAPPTAAPPSRGGIIAAAVLAAVVILMGGMTATTGAAPACQGFPLCNGQIWPSDAGGGLQHIHWTHRLLAYALFLHVLGLGLGLKRKGAARRILRAAWVTVGLTVAQVAVGALMVLTQLSPHSRGLHAALGTAVWAALVWLLWLTVSGSRAGAREGAAAAQAA
jgi:heme A synthase